MTTYDKYTPDFKCESDGNGKGVVNASIGLLDYDEVVYSSQKIFVVDNDGNMLMNTEVL